MQRILPAMLAVLLLLPLISSCPSGGDESDTVEPAAVASADDGATDDAGTKRDQATSGRETTGGGSTELVVRNLFDQRAAIERELETLAATPGLAPERVAELQDELAALDDELKELAEKDRDAVLSELEVLASVDSEIAGEWQALAGGDAPEEDTEPAGMVIALLGDPYTGPERPIDDLRDELDEVWTVEFSTTFGEFSLEVYPELAPIHAVRFLELVEAGFYDNMHVHRIAPGWVVQWGDLYDLSDAASLRPGEEPPVYPRYEDRKGLVVELKDEPVRFPARQWTVCFAKRGPDTASTQPFINLANNSRLSDMSQETYFTPFAYVTEGRDNVERLVESFNPAMESAKADLRAQLEADGAPEEAIEQYLLNDLAWQQYVGQYWDPFRMALITEARIVKSPGGH